MSDLLLAAVADPDEADAQAYEEQARDGQIIVDLARIVDRWTEAGRYAGICW